MAEKEAEDTTKKGKKTSKEREDIYQSIQALRAKTSNVTNKRNHMASQLIKKLADISDSKEYELR